MIESTLWNWAYLPILTSGVKPNKRTCKTRSGPKPMSFADDLLEQSFHLSNRDVGKPKQASLRRAVSTAYYALFHLLIDESVSARAVERQRSVLARTFDHGKMKSVCESTLKTATGGGRTPPELVTVAQNFIRLQDWRHAADYNNAMHWSHTDAI